jgi:hypothetical protein
VKDQRVILFVFAGRQPNLELQLPLVRRILAENPNVEYHVWNFTRNDSDREFVKNIAGERITVFNGTDAGFASPAPTGDGAQFGANEHNAAYRHYSQPGFKDHVFVKVDDDIVFLETARWPAFIATIQANPESVCIANIVNNGASTPITPGIWKRYQTLQMPLLDIHMSGKFADLVHTYFFDNTNNMLNQPVELIPTEDWTSINCVGYTHDTLTYVLKQIGTPQPAYLAGRPMHGWGRVFGDEGVFQTLPRIIVKGFTAAHLTFGPQNPTDRQLAVWREKYHELGDNYLNSNPVQWAGTLPEFSETSCAYVGQRLAPGQVNLSWRQRWTPEEHVDPSTGNNPTAGRYTP